MIPTVDQLLVQFKSSSFSRGVNGEARSWSDKFKQWFTVTAIQAQVIVDGKLSDEYAPVFQAWLEEQYKAIDNQDQKVPGWKTIAVYKAAAAIKSYTEYRSRLWAAALRLFHGGRDAAFLATFVRSIDVELTKAWNEGGAAFNISPDEMTERDMEVLSGIIDNENKYVEGMAEAIQQAHDAEMEDDKFERQFGNRVNVWANRYNDVINQAMLYWGAKERLIWKEGDTNKKCATCPRLNGIVAFGDEWSRAGFHPQRPPNHKIECGGWGCHCSLTPTKKRRTTNALKKLLAM